MATKNCKNGCDLKGSRSHAKGGIKGVVEGSQKQIEVESNEVIIRASVLNDPKRYIYTGTHRQIVEQINGGFNSVVNDSDDCILVEAGQVVINKKTLDDDKIRTYTGTNKEVLNKINKHLNSGVSIYKNGGIIPIGNNKIKTIFFKKDKFTKPQAIAWAKNHGFDYAQSYDENKSNYIFRCNDKNAFKKHTYRTIELKESGIKIIIGVEKMEQGGSVEDVYELDFYRVTQSSERDTDYLYQGIDFDKAKSEYNYASEQDDDTNVILEKYTNKYKFVYELDADNEETIDDYPIEDYYEDSDYYKLVENGLDSGTEILESKELHRVKSNKENIEEEFEQLQSDFIDSFENDYKNKIHLQEYAGFMGSSKYYYLLIDENGSLIDVDKENPLLLLEKKDSTFDDRIARSFQNINPENAVLCVRISDHERVYNTYGDACLSIVFDRKSDRIEIQNTDSDNENIIELVYGIEKYFDNYSIAELSDVEYSVKSVIDDFDYNNMIQNRGEFEDDEYKQGGSITQNTISENRKEFMIRESKMNNFVRTFYSDIENKYPIKIDNTHDKFQMFGVKGHFEFLIPLDKMEGEILMYFEMLTNRSMADFLNTKGNVIVTPVIKCYIDKDYNITFDYSELDKYLEQYGVEEFKEGGEVIRKTKNTPFTQLCNVFKSEMERDYGFKFTENSDNFNSRYGNGHVEFTMKKDDKDATAFIYFEGKRGFPIIFGFDEKGDYYADYSTFETVLKLIKREEFAEGGEVKKKVARRNLPLNTTYKIIDSFYTGGLFENPHICENCGKPIANVGVVENEKGEDFEVGMDCAKTLSGIDDDLKFTDAEDDFKKANQIRQKINKAKKNESLKITTEITYFRGDVVIEAVNKNNDRYEYRIASEPQDFIEKYMPDVLKMISNKEKLGYKPKYTKIFGFDFSKIQRKGNDFEYSFDNVRFKVYDLEKTSDSGVVNSHIAFDVYVDDKLIGSDTTYNQRDLEVYILGILNKYYFEKYDNLYRKTTKTDTEILQGGLSDNKTILDIPTYDDWFSKIKFNTVGGYVLPDGTKGIGKKTNEEWFKKLYNKRFKQEKEILQGGVADKKTIEKIAKQQNIDNIFYAYAQLKKGIAVELEHTDNKEIAREIALDHLSESINYYVELEKMEEKLNNIKLSSNYTDSQLIELCKKADINKETLVFDVPDDKVEYYKSLGFVVKN